MKIATWGSKICDDALKYSRNESVCRIVEISPFSLLTQHYDKMQTIRHEWSVYENNDFLNNIMALDYSKQTLQHIIDADSDLVVISLDSLRRYLREFHLSDGTSFRIEEDNSRVKYLLEIRKRIEADLGVNIIREQVVRPMLFDDEQLKNEIEGVCTLIKQHLNTEKLVLLKTHNAYQYIDINNKIVPAIDMVDVVNKQNAFYDKCVELFMKNITCQTIECPDILVGDVRRGGFNIFHFTLIYYEYINKCIDAIGKGEYTECRKNEMLNEYLDKQQNEIEEIILRPIIDLAYHRRNGRRLVLIGKSDVFEYNLKKKYGLVVDLKIPYGEKCNVEEIRSSLKAIQYRNKEYLCIVPFIKGDVPILKLLWSYGYGYGKGYVCNVHDSIFFKNFRGIYEDFYNNRIECNRTINLELRGIGNNFFFGAGKSASNDTIIVLSQTKVEIENGVELEEEGFSATLYDGAELKIASNTVIEKNAHIRGTFFSKTKIGANCNIGEDAVIFNGDGHSIFDLHTGKNINYDLNQVPDFKREILIGDNVYVGDNCFVLSGTNIVSNCTVRDNSFVNKVFANPCLIAGNPAKEIKEVL